MGMFDSFEDGSTGKPKTMKAKDLDLSVPKSQSEAQDEDSYVSYQRDMLLGLNDTPTLKKPSGSSLMSNIRNRLLMKKKMQEQKQQSRADEQATQLLQTQTQVISSNDSQAKITQSPLKTQAITQLESDDAKIAQTQIVSSSLETQIVGSQINNGESENDSDDDIVTVKKRVHIMQKKGEKEDEEEEDNKDDEIVTVTQTQKLTASVTQDIASEEIIQQTQIIRKKVTFIGSEDEEYDSDDQKAAPVDFKPREAYDADLEGPDTKAQDRVLNELLGNESNASNGTIDSSYKWLSKEERIKARAEEHKRQRELEEKENQNESAISLAPQKLTEKEFSDKLLTAKDSKVQMMMDLMVQKERADSVLIKKALEDIITIDAPRNISKDKLIEQLGHIQNSKSAHNEIIENPSIKSPEKLEKHSENTIVFKAPTENDKVIYLASDDDSSESEIDETKAKLISLNLKMKLAKKNNQKKESRKKMSLEERIKLLSAKQSKLHTHKSYKNRVDLTNDDMVLELLHQDQLRDAENQKRERLKLKQEKLRKQGIFPTHDDDDPEFSGDDEDEEEGEVEGEDDEEVGEEANSENDSEGNGEGSEEIAPEEDAVFPSESLDNREDDITIQQPLQSNPFKKLGISMSQLFNAGTQAPSQIQETVHSDLTTKEKFQKMKHIANEMIGENVEEHTHEDDSIIDISTQRLNEVSFISKQVLLESESQSQKLTQASQPKNDLHRILGSPDMEISTQQDADTPADDQTQKDEAREISTGNVQVIDADGDEDEDEDDEDKITIGRKKKHDHSDSGAESVAEEEIEETEEERALRIQAIKLQKQKEKQMRIEKERKMKQMGLNTVMENEADESEDEFKGIGGVDGEDSDEENSEDEKMIDYTKDIDLKENEIRQKFLEKELEQDKADVAQAYKKVQTHNFRDKKSNTDAFGELSDDDDDIYNRLRQLRNQRMQNEFEGLHRVKSSKNDPRRAFNEEMAIKLPSKVLSFRKESMTEDVMNELKEEQEEQEEGEEENMSDVYTHDEFEIPTQPSQQNKRNNPSFNESTSKRQKIPEPFAVDLDSLTEQDSRVSERERLQRELLSDSEDDSGSSVLERIKSSSTIQLSRHNSYRRPQSQVTNDDNDEEEEEDESFGLLATKTRSITSSFKKASTKQVRRGMFTGNIIREVSVTTSSRAVLNSKSTVTKLASSEKTTKKSANEDESNRMASMLEQSRRGGINKIGNAKFRR